MGTALHAKHSLNATESNLKSCFGHSPRLLCCSVYCSPSLSPSPSPSLSPSLSCPVSRCSLAFTLCFLLRFDQHRFFICFTPLGLAVTTICLFLVFLLLFLFYNPTKKRGAQLYYRSAASLAPEQRQNSSGRTTELSCNFAQRASSIAPLTHTNTQTQDTQHSPTHTHRTHNTPTHVCALNKLCKTRILSKYHRMQKGNCNP